MTATDQSSIFACIHAALRHTPIVMHSAQSDITMKRGIRPSRNAISQTMFDRVVMNIIHMRPQIVVIADRVLPETLGPDCRLTAAGPWNTYTPGLQSPRESAFEYQQPCRIRFISFGQAPHCMYMLRQHHHRNDLERAFCLGLPQRPSQGVDLLNKHPRRAIRQCQREEICAAGHTIASI